MSRFHALRTIMWISAAGLFLWTASARASDIAFFIGAWNPGWYDERQFEHVDQIIDNTAHRFDDIQKFDDDQLGDLEVWTNANMTDGELDIIWLNGQMPSVLYPFPNKMPDDSLAELWLDNGNMFINVADPFGYVSHECGERCEENGLHGAANILDLNEGWVLLGGSQAMKKTATAERFMPSLRDVLITFRPVAIVEIIGDWEVAAVFASDNGNEPGNKADPAVIHNTRTNGYLAIINQSADGLWIDRPAAVSEFINLWVPTNAVGYSVDPIGKLTATWGRLKRAS